MKTYRTVIAVFFILFAFACNNNQNKKNIDNPSDAEKPASEYSNIENKDQSIQKELKPIESIVKEILITSPRYIELTKDLNESVIKNGGLSFEVVLERSPYQNQNNTDYSKTFDFVIYENYPYRRLSTARFSFNPENKQLYEYDAANDQLKAIKFDRDLLIKYAAVSKLNRNSEMR